MVELELCNESQRSSFNAVKFPIDLKIPRRTIIQRIIAYAVKDSVEGPTPEGRSEGREITVKVIVSGIVHNLQQEGC